MRFLFWGGEKGKNKRRESGDFEEDILCEEINFRDIVQEEGRETRSNGRYLIIGLNDGSYGRDYLDILRENGCGVRSVNFTNWSEGLDGIVCTDRELELPVIDKVKAGGYNIFKEI